MNCDKCINREFKDKLYCCQVNRLDEAFNDGIIKLLGHFVLYDENGVGISKHECSCFEEDTNVDS